jgi:hypothetical protein
MPFFPSFFTSKRTKDLDLELQTKINEYNPSLQSKKALVHVLYALLKLKDNYNKHINIQINMMIGAKQFSIYLTVDSFLQLFKDDPINISQVIVQFNKDCFSSNYNRFSFRKDCCDRIMKFVKACNASIIPVLNRFRGFGVTDLRSCGIAIHPQFNVLDFFKTCTPNNSTLYDSDINSFLQCWNQSIKPIGDLRQQQPTTTLTQEEEEEETEYNANSWNGDNTVGGRKRTRRRQKCSRIRNRNRNRSRRRNRRRSL